MWICFHSPFNAPTSSIVRSKGPYAAPISPKPSQQPESAPYSTRCSAPHNRNDAHSVWNRLKALRPEKCREGREVISTLPPDAPSIEIDSLQSSSLIRCAATPDRCRIGDTQ